VSTGSFLRITPDSVVRFDLGGSPMIAGSGSVELAGTWSVASATPLEPQPGQIVPVVSVSGGIAGQFRNTTAQGNVGGQNVDVSIIYGASNASVRINQVLSAQVDGDYNRDGIVNAVDYVYWRDKRGAAVAPYSNADGNGNGIVDQADQGLWKRNFGKTEAQAPTGDYNRNGVVNAADYILWRDTLGRTGSSLAADGSGNNIVDQADYILWKRNFERTESQASTGDYNQNGVVNAADYVRWRDTLGRTGASLAADGSGNNIVDQADYQIWKSHFGETTGGGLGTSSSGSAIVSTMTQPTFVDHGTDIGHRSTKSAFETSFSIINAIGSAPLDHKSGIFGQLASAPSTSARDSIVRDQVFGAELPTFHRYSGWASPLRADFDNRNQVDTVKTARMRLAIAPSFIPEWNGPINEFRIPVGKDAVDLVFADDEVGPPRRACRTR
jgi:hypothetical protein